ncbi:MAG TPA: winged helix-turn-helix transcriptional regulator [Candidatus Limnocylindrales bacterium]|nr:winged helix-turn-helix transcriptional regulator [Candidatus Limnocylindrales bacterium]
MERHKVPAARGCDSRGTGNGWRTGPGTPALERERSGAGCGDDGLVHAVALNELEADGVLHREVYRQVTPKVEYTLTSIGERLKPVLDLMLDWGAEYMAERYPDVELLTAPPAELGTEAAGDRAERPAL